MASQMIKGNTAIIIGAMYAGCDCFFWLSNNSC